MSSGPSTTTAGDENANNLVNKNEDIATAGKDDTSSRSETRSTTPGQSQPTSKDKTAPNTQEQSAVPKFKGGRPSPASSGKNRKKKKQAPQHFSLDLDDSGDWGSSSQVLSSPDLRAGKKGGLDSDVGGFTTSSPSPKKGGHASSSVSPGKPGKRRKGSGDSVDNFFCEEPAGKGEEASLGVPRGQSEPSPAAQTPPPVAGGRHSRTFSQSSRRGSWNSADPKGSCSLTGRQSLLIRFRIFSGR